MNQTQNALALPEFIVLEPKSGVANAAVIWLHGLGADGHDFEGIVPELGLPENHAIRFVFPHAPISPVTINGGMEMRSWYDIRSLDFFNDFDAQGVGASTQAIAGLIHQQIESGIAPESILLAGFSQGGLIALHCGLSFPAKLAGIVALSTYCPKGDQFSQHKEMPILMMHGEQDTVIPLTVAETSKTALAKQGYVIEWHQYPMAHQVIWPQINTLGKWIQARLG